MLPPTAERTTQIPTTYVAGMSEKPNPAVNAMRDATIELGMGLQDRVQGDLILPDKWPGAIELMPIRPKREKLLGGYDKKARLSVTMRSDLSTPSSYLIEAKASRGRARFFCALEKYLSLTEAIPLPRSTPARRARLLEMAP
jgi:hypothetical protein